MSRHQDGDARLQEQVRRELALDFLIDESQIDVEVDGGVVTLVGTVGSLAEKRVAQSAAQVEGVHDLINAIDVKPPADMHPSDEELRTTIEQVLAWDALVPEQGLTVSVVDGLVALTGTCPTRAQADEAERAVTHLAGVRDVLNRIEIALPSPSPADVRAVIAEVLGRRAAHQAAQLDVVVDGTTVTLGGAVQSPMERRAVIGAVSHTAGITEVRDDLRIDGRAPA